MSEAARIINTLLTIVLEIVVLAAYSFAGFQLTDDPILKLLLAIALPALILNILGIFLILKIHNKIGPTALFLVFMFVTLTVCVLLTIVGYLLIALILGIVVSINNFIAWKLDSRVSVMLAS